MILFQILLLSKEKLKFWLARQWCIVYIKLIVGHILEELNIKIHVPIIFLDGGNNKLLFMKATQKNYIKFILLYLIGV